MQIKLGLRGLTAMEAWVELRVQAAGGEMGRRDPIQCNVVVFKLTELATL